MNACCDWYALAHPESRATATTSARTCPSHYRPDGSLPDPDEWRGTPAPRHTNAAGIRAARGIAARAALLDALRTAGWRSANANDADTVDAALLDAGYELRRMARR